MTAPFVFDRNDIERQLGGRFTNLHELRVGGQGTVYRAHRVAAADGSPADDIVALKLHLDPTQDERADREIQAMQGVRHRQIATLIEHGAITSHGQQTRFVVWEFIDGQPLDHRIGQGVIHPRIPVAGILAHPASFPAPFEALIVDSQVRMVFPLSARETTTRTLLLAIMDPVGGKQ